MSAQPQIAYREYEQLMDDYANSEKEVRRLRRVVSMLQRELNDKREDAPGSSDVRAVLAHYVTKFRKTKAFKVGPSTERWRLVEKALKDHTVAELTEAIDGLHAMPYVGPHGRQPSGTDDQRHDEIEICIRNEMFVDRFRGYVAKAKAMQQEPAPVPQKPRRVRDSDWSYARTDVELELLTALEQKGCHPVEKGRGWQALCPAHEDHSPSLSVNWNGAEDKLLVKCWAGCETVYVMDALGLPLSALFRDEPRRAA